MSDNYNFRNAPRNTTQSSIAIARLSAGMTQKELADAIGVSAQHISLWERGTVKPTYKYMRKISSILKIPLESIYTLEDNHPYSGRKFILMSVRMEKNISQHRLAKEIGISQSMISNYETGQRMPTIAQVQRIAAALDVDPDDLFEPESEDT